LLQTENAALNSRLQEVQEQLADREAELRGRLNMNEMQLKEQMVYNVSVCGARETYRHKRDSDGCFVRLASLTAMVD
jgi:hypothetical protein